MSEITTHVLDAALGKPAGGVGVRLEKQTADGWVKVATGATDAGGRCRDLARDVAPGIYRLTFDSGAYLALIGCPSIYPEISITFTCGGDAHYHLPLLLSGNAYTTYRGS